LGQAKAQGSGLVTYSSIGLVSDRFFMVAMRSSTSEVAFLGGEVERGEEAVGGAMGEFM
jgi:hypothetical protein